MEKKTEKPWGCEVLWANTSRYAAKFLYVKRGHRSSLHLHNKRDESIIVDRGRIKIHWITVGEKLSRIQVLTPGDHFDIPAGTAHRFEAIDDACIVVVSSPELDDVVRLEDDYGRLE